MYIILNGHGFMRCVTSECEADTESSGAILMMPVMSEINWQDAIEENI